MRNIFFDYSTINAAIYYKSKNSNDNDNNKTSTPNEYLPARNRRQAFE